MKKYGSFWKYCLLAVSLILVIICGQGKLIAQIENTVGPSTTATITQCKSEAANYATCLTQQGYDYFNRGDARSALEIWQQAEIAYPENSEGVIGSQINQGMALQALGQSRQACQVLVNALYANNLYSICDVTSEKTLDLPEISQSLVNAIGLRNLGEVLRAIGKLDESQEVLEKSLEISEKINSEEEIALGQLELGNTARAQFYKYTNLYERTDSKAKAQQDAIGQAELALAFYRQIRETTPVLQIKSQLNQLSLLVELKDWLSEINQSNLFTHESAITDLINSLETSSELTNLKNLPPSKFAVDARINFALSLSKLGQSDMAFTHAEKARGIAATLKNPSAEYYALGVLGELFYDRYLDLKQDEDLTQAEDVTKQAIAIANKIPDSANFLYEWQWHLGQIYQAQGNIQGAIAAYEAAVNNIEVVRRDLLAIDAELRFSFREKIKPIYEDLIWSLLHQVEPQQKNFKKVTELISQFQQAELENAFGCIQSELINLSKDIEPKNNQTSYDLPDAIIYTIVLDREPHNAIEVILKTADEYYYNSTRWTDVKKNIDNLQEILQEEDLYDYPTELISPDTQKLYELFIGHAETHLPATGDLVFVVDSSLSNIPMGLLQDKQNQYLVQNYRISTILGAQLREPKKLNLGKSTALIAGAAQWQNAQERNLDPLNYITDELNEFEKLTVARSRLENQEFTRNEFQNKIAYLPVQIIHIATHAKFSSDPDRTRIEAYDQAITLKELKYLLQRKTQSSLDNIELLVLSACQTAKGDERSGLGLAGVALQAGARSTVASLWNVNDPSTPKFMKEFYQRLKDGETKAEALRQAQLAFLEDEQYSNYRHPYYWASFILVGSWL